MINTIFVLIRIWDFRALQEVNEEISEVGPNGEIEETV